MEERASPNATKGGRWAENRLCGVDSGCSKRICRRMPPSPSSHQPPNHRPATSTAQRELSHAELLELVASVASAVACPTLSVSKPQRQ